MIDPCSIYLIGQNYTKHDYPIIPQILLKINKYCRFFLKQTLQKVVYKKKYV